jgi:hypothetical protein
VKVSTIIASISNRSEFSTSHASMRRYEINALQLGIHGLDVFRYFSHFRKDVSIAYVLKILGGFKARDIFDTSDISMCKVSKNAPGDFNQSYILFIFSLCGFLSTIEVSCQLVNCQSLWRTDVLVKLEAKEYRLTTSPRSDHSSSVHFR